MKAIEPVTVEKLRALLSYDPQDGTLTWKERAEQRAWNTKYAGKPALTTRHSDGYRMGKVEGRRVYAHRVAFAIQHGRWPAGLVDHINGDRSDNRAENLRDVDYSKNSKNVRKNIRRSGVPCILWVEGSQRWRVRVGTAERRIDVGSFKDLDEAVQALKDAGPQG